MMVASTKLKILSDIVGFRTPAIDFKNLTNLVCTSYQETFLYESFYKFLYRKSKYVIYWRNYKSHQDAEC